MTKRSATAGFHDIGISHVLRSASSTARRHLYAGVSLPALLVAGMVLPMAGVAQARDVLRFNAGSNAAAMATASTQQAAAVAKLSQDALARATQSIQAMRTAQSAARNLALAVPSTISDGLSANAGLTPGLVPDSGLAASGVANPVTSWFGAQTPTQATSNGQTAVTIQQTAPQALLNWSSFNVSKNTTVNFNQQGNSSWVALNKINDPSGVPSQILGQIRADGSVYLINRNGIIFGGSSQVNVHTLIASSLDLNDKYATNPFQSAFLTGAGTLSDGAHPNFWSVDSNGNPYSAGPVTVSAGAQITAPGGAVLLLAPTVRNDGAISTPSGQTLLLGGSDVLLTAGDSYTRGFVVTPNPSLPNVNIVGPSPFQGPNSNTSQAYGFYSSTTPGTVVNNGSIAAPQGNIMMVAGTIAQNGVLTSTTSTTKNGSVLIRAETGSLVLGGPNDNPLYAAYGVAPQPSLIQIIPDATDQSLITDAQAVANSSISLTGVNVGISGIVQLHGYDLTSPNDHPGGITIAATGSQTALGRVFLEAGSLLDASGTTDATVSASRNSVAVQLRTNELRNSPLVKAGRLYQQTIYVDASASGTNADGSSWVGTPLADASAWIALTTRSLDERLMNGAPITIGGALIPIDQGGTLGQLPANLVQAPGSLINISGGYLTYTPGFVHVSRLITVDWHLVSATNADPTTQYLGICCSFKVSHPHWGISETFNAALINQGYDSPGYIQGGAGGSLKLVVQAAVLDGQIYSTVVQGEKQRTIATAPSPAALSVDSTSLNALPNLTYGTAYTADNIVLSDGAAATAAQWVTGFDTGTDLNALLTANSAPPNSVYIPSSWLNSGMTSVGLGANGRITLPPGNPITLTAGGSFSASANWVDIESSILVPGGTIALTGAFTTASSLVNNPNGTVSAAGGLVTVGRGVTLRAAGSWTNDANSMSAAVSIATNGGTIAVRSTGNINLGQDNRLDVSGGGYETSARKLTVGNGGILTLTAGLPLVPAARLPLNTPLPVQAPLGHINFAGGTLASRQLEGYGVNTGKGGSLTLASYDVATIVAPAQAGGALVSQLPAAIDGAGNSYVPLAISTALFSSGGFSTISLTAAGINLPAGITLAPTVTSLTLSNSWAPSQPSLAGIATPILLPQGIRSAASITLHAAGDLWNRTAAGTGIPTSLSSVDAATYGLDIAGTITTDSKGAVTLTGDQIAIVSGLVAAPSGTIAFGGATYNNGALAHPLDGEGVWLTGTGQLLAKGAAVTVPQSNGVAYADVLPGGLVTVSGGDIILAPGSVIDVSGATGASTLLAAGAGRSRSVAGLLTNRSALATTTQVSSAGGTISISAILGAVLEGTLLGGSGGGSAAGGTLSLALAEHGTDGSSGTGGYWPAVESTYITLQQSLQPGDRNYVGGALLQPGNNPGASPTNDAEIYVPAQTVASGGFASLSLKAPFVTFSGNTVLALPGQLVFNTATIIVPAGATETLGANYVQWSNPIGGIARPPMGGTGMLNLVANTVDLIGNLAVQGAGRTSFSVAGDIRLTGSISIGTGFPQLSGALFVGGELDLAAGQIYPTTDTGYVLASPTKIVFTPIGAPPPAPLSAGGTLSVYAPEIDQSGTLRAPTGTINLGLQTTGDTATVSTTAGVGVRQWQFTTTGQTFIPGQAVTITSQDGTVTVTGLVDSATASPPGGSLTVDVIALTGLGPQSTVPGGTWTVSAPGTTLNLGAGSLTSVSAGGQKVLYGYVQNGTAWYYNPSSASSVLVTAPPAKQINLSGGAITVAAGATLDAAGGGDLYAGEFVPGTGGSTNIFTGANVYAVMPGYSGITPYDPYASSALPSIGRQIYLNGVPGLPAGTYTLLPGQYAQLPGTFRVTLQTAPGASTIGATRAPMTTAAEPDGSYVTAGHFVTPGTGTTDQHWSRFQVMSDQVARQYSEVDSNYASSFFKVKAAAAGTAVPRLPQDAGQLTISASTSLSFQGTGNFTPGPGGLGGLADISANQILVVDGAVRNDIIGGAGSVASYRPGSLLVGGATDVDPADAWNPIVLAAGDLNRLGVESLLLGGSRSFQSGGVTVNTVATNVVIANSGRDPLVLPDIQLIAMPKSTTNTVTSTNSQSSLTLVSAKVGTGQVIIAPSAVIEASGAVAPGGASTYILSTTLETVPAPINVFGVGSSALKQYGSTGVQAYYQEAFANQFGYVRVSGGDLTTIVGGNATYAGFATGGTTLLDNYYVLPSYPIGGSVTVGSGAQLISGNSLTLFASGSGSVSSGVTITAQQVLLKSGQISLGTGNHALPGLVLEQAALDSLAGVKALTLVSAGEIDLYGGLTLGQIDPATGQPILGKLTFDSAALVEKGMSGTATFTAEQVTFQNSLGGTVAPTPPVGGTALAITAADMLATDPSGKVTGYNNAMIALGAGATALAGFGSVDLRSSGQIIAIGDGGSLLVQAPLTLDAPRISAGSMSIVGGLPKFGTVSYTITAADNPTSPATYYGVNLVNSGGATPALPSALLGNRLTITGGQTDIETAIALPGGTFTLIANGAGGNITVGSQGTVDVSGQAIRFADVLATIGGGTINMTSASGAITIQPGAILNVGDLTGIGALNQTSAGTLSLSAPIGGVTIAAGSLQGQGPSGADRSGAFALDTSTLATTAPLTYDGLAALLVAGGFESSWNIRARNGDIAMTGLTLARNVTVGADTGSIDVAGTVDAHGATGGQIALWAGKNLTLEATAMLNAHGTSADANGRGGQVWLGAAQAWDGLAATTWGITLNVGARIDVGADGAAAGVSSPVFGGAVIFSTAPTGAGTGVNLAVTGGSTFANFLRGVTGESPWDGVVVVGNHVYSYSDTTLTLTPSTTIAASGGVETAAFTTYLNDAAAFMANESTIWGSLGANSSIGVANGVLINIRPGIVIKNPGGDITIAGNIDLSGSAYAGSVLNQSGSPALVGHFGQYDEPVVLTIRAGGNLNFGAYDTSSRSLTLGGLSDGFWPYYSNNSGGISPLYPAGSAAATSLGAATLFDPAAAGAYNGLSGGLGADSATYFLTAGADTAAANPLAIMTHTATGTLTVAGITGDSNLTTAILIGSSYAVTADPLYLYNNDANGNSNSFTTVSLADFVDYASLVRTGTGNIAIATAKDLVLQSPLSLIYTGGTGYNVNGSGAQPLGGFTQYNGMLTISGKNGGSANTSTLPASTFPTHGGDVILAVGGNITGDMNAGFTTSNVGTNQQLPYDMTALGSQLKLQNWYTALTAAAGGTSTMGAFSALYATDAWMNGLTRGNSYYTVNNIPGTQGAIKYAATPGNYQLAWYTWFPFLENTIGSFGGGNISAKAGGSISNVQFVAPTNARDAGPALVATNYGYDPNLLTNPTDIALLGAAPIVGGYAGLYVQGGGNISVTAGGNITSVYSYAQNGATALNAGGSVSGACVAACGTNQAQSIPIVIATSTGSVSVQAGGSINIADSSVEPGLGLNTNAVTLSGISLIQNASYLINLYPGRVDKTFTREATVLTGLLTAVPTGSVTLQAVGGVTLGVNATASWNTSQGILPPQVNLISLQDDVTNTASFITYPNPAGTVDLLARGSVNLNAGFVLSDAAPSIMPTLANIAAKLAPFTTTVTAQNQASTTLTPNTSYPRIGDPFSSLGGANYLAGQDVSHVVLGGDTTGQLIRDLANLTQYGFTVPPAAVTPQTTSERHAGLHLGNGDPARIIALNGDVRQGGTPQNDPTVGLYDFRSPYETITKATKVYAGRDITNLALIGQNNNATDITSIVAGRDVIYPPNSAANASQIPFAIEIGGPGNLMIQSGRNIDLGNSAGIQTFGNFLNPRLPSQGAGITIEAGLGSALTLPDYAAFTAQYVSPTTAAANPYAEPLQLFDATGNLIGSGGQAYAYLQSLSPMGQEILLNRIFFDLVRDSGREHSGASGTANYELGSISIDTLAASNAAYANYQRAYAAIGTFLGRSSDTGSFLGGLSTVRSLSGGNITILAPHGQIQVGLIAPPVGFSYSQPNDPTYALGFGIVTEKGGNVDLYASGDISVNQSRVFTLEGGDLTVVSLKGNIDAGRGSKTVQTIQPPNVSYDSYGNITITPYGPASGSGLATIRATADSPPGNADLIAPNGSVNAGDAGIRVSGNLNIAAVQILNAGNIQVQGTTTGIQTAVAPNIGALTAASNQAGAAANAATDAAKQSRSRPPQQDLPSIITVEVIGYGDGGANKGKEEQRNETYTIKKQQSYDPNSRLQVIGLGNLREDEQSSAAENKVPK